MEYAFGILVHRWSILRQPLLSAMGPHKITALTMCLCTLYNNFLIDETNSKALHNNTAYSVCQGNIPLVPHQIHCEADVPDQLLHGGEHFNDADANMVKRDSRVTTGRILPQEILKNSVINQGFVRPTPKRW